MVIGNKHLHGYQKTASSCVPSVASEASSSGNHQTGERQSVCATAHIVYIGYEVEFLQSGDGHSRLTYNYYWAMIINFATRQHLGTPPCRNRRASPHHFTKLYTDSSMSQLNSSISLLICPSPSLPCLTSGVEYRVQRYNLFLIMTKKKGIYLD